MGRIVNTFGKLTTGETWRDGDMNQLVNLRSRGGTLRPVAAHEATSREYAISTGYDHLYMHTPHGLELLVGARGNEVWRIGEEQAVLIGTTAEAVRSIESVGILLAIVTTAGIYYAKWTNTDYAWLGELPQLPEITLSATAGTPTIAGSGLYKDAGERNERLTSALKSNILYCLNKNWTEKKNLTDAHLVRYAYRLYDGTTVCPSSPILVAPDTDIHGCVKAMWRSVIAPNSNSGYYADGFVAKVTGYDINMTPAPADLSAWRDIIMRIDVFMSEAVGFNSVAHFDKSQINTLAGSTYVGDEFQPETWEPSTQLYTTGAAAAVGKMREESLFYKIAELNINADGSIEAKTGIVNKSSLSALENLKYAELLTDNGYTNHRYGAQNSSTYNKRLRLVGSTTSLFAGHPLCKIPSYAWNGVIRPSGTHAQLRVTVYLQIEGREQRVQRNYSYAGDGATSLFLNPYISYPDARATKIVIENAGLQASKTIKLQPHPTLNIAYAVNMSATNNTPAPWIFGAYGVETNYHALEGSKTINNSDTIRVSDTENPFSFPAKNTYRLDGHVLSEATIAMNVSDRNYGIYPMYAFTSAGIYALSRPGQDDTVHETVNPVYTNPVLSAAVCSTPHGVAFAGIDGLYLINNNGIEELTRELSEQYIEMPVLLDEDPLCGGFDIEIAEDLHELFQAGDILTMYYDPFDSELHVIGEKHHCVYSFAGKSWYQSTESIKMQVRGGVSGGDAMLYGGDGQLYDSFKRGGSVQVYLSSHPFRFGSADRKALQRAEIRMMLEIVGKNKIILWGSMDDRHYQALRGYSITEADKIKDLDMGIFGASKYRSYIITICGEIGATSEIRGCEFSIKADNTNDKMR